MKIQVYQYPKKLPYDLHDLKADIQHHTEIDYGWLLREPTNRIFMSEEIYKLQNAVTGYPTLNEISRSMRGIEGYKYKYNPTATSSNWLPFFTRQIYRYAVYGNGVKYVDFTRHLDHPDYLAFFKGQRILLRRIVSRRNRLQATIVSDDFVIGKDLYSIKVTDPGYDLRYVLAVLNSALISYLYYMRSTVAQKDDFRQTTLEEIRGLPILQASAQEQLAIGVDRLMVFKKKLQELAFKNDLKAYYHAQPICDTPLSKILRWNSLKPRSEKRILDTEHRRGVISEMEISAKGDWLTLSVSGREKPKVGEEKEFSHLPLFRVRVKEPSLRRYIARILCGRKSISASKQTILDAVLDQKLPAFAANLRTNTLEIKKLVEAYQSAFLTYQQLAEEIRQTEAQIDSRVFLTYGISPDTAKVIMESLERDASPGAGFSPVSDVGLDEDYQRRVLEAMR